jgi:hypothetical protein
MNSAKIDVNLGGDWSKGNFAVAKKWGERIKPLNISPGERGGW